MKLNILDRVKRFIKLLYALPNYKQVLKKINNHSGQKRGILIGTPVHGNLGDHLITKESIKYLKKFDFEEIIEIPEIFYELFYKKIHFSPDDLLFISGGGWMGSLYYDEIIIEDIIRRWNYNRIIILPQTVSFAGGNYTTEKRLSTLLNSHKKIILTVRDENSYNVCLNNLNIDKGKLFLLPDMALLGLNEIVKANKNQKEIILSIRNDREKSNNIDMFDLKKILEEKYNVIFSSSVIDKKAIKIKDREEYIYQKINEYSKSNIVITDRLHSMVFALLAGTKCIAIDNSTHKVLGVYKRWLQEQKGIWIISKEEQLSTELIDKVYNSKETISCKNYTKYFGKLDSIIKEDLL